MSGLRRLPVGAGMTLCPSFPVLFFQHFVEFIPGVHNLAVFTVLQRRLKSGDVFIQLLPAAAQLPFSFLPEGIPGGS